MKNNLKSILFSIVFTILFILMILIELPSLLNYIKYKDILNIVLSSSLILIAATGLYISIIYGIVKILNTKSKKTRGGSKNGKKKKK
ncbi:MAG: hypothetical protein IJO32_01120 [Bacilli bacterium]|nr:hypothetical protein [Bacilli bacterium]